MVRSLFGFVVGLFCVGVFVAVTTTYREDIQAAGLSAARWADETLGTTVAPSPSQQPVQETPIVEPATVEN